MPSIKSLLSVWKKKFRNPRLLRSAVTHPSYRHEHPDHSLENFDRLEFFGDSILNYVICKKIYGLFPHASEGNLSHIRSVLVSRKTLAQVAGDTGLEQESVLGSSLQKQPGISKDKVLADIFEAVIAAVYLDSGLKRAESFVLQCFRPWLSEKKLLDLAPNPKSLLQEFCQKHWNRLPAYRSTPNKEGVTTEVLASRRWKASATASSKRASEEAAAKNLLEKLLQEFSSAGRKKSSGRKLSNRE